MVEGVETLRFQTQKVLLVRMWSAKYSWWEPFFVLKPLWSHSFMASEKKTADSPSGKFSATDGSDLFEISNLFAGTLRQHVQLNKDRSATCWSIFLCSQTLTPQQWGKTCHTCLTAPVCRSSLGRWFPPARRKNHVFFSASHDATLPAACPQNTLDRQTDRQS